MTSYVYLSLPGGERIRMTHREAQDLYEQLLPMFEAQPQQPAGRPLWHPPAPVDGRKKPAALG